MALAIAWMIVWFFSAGVLTYVALRFQKSGETSTALLLCAGVAFLVFMGALPFLVGNLI